MFRATIPLIAITLALALAAYSTESSKEHIVRTEQAISKYDPTRDYFTFANVDQLVTKNLDLTVDFDAQQLHGSATLNMKRLMEVIYSKERADLHNVIGYHELLLDFDQVAPQR